MDSNPVEVPNFFLFHLNLSYSCNLHVKKKQNLPVNYILLFDFLMARQWLQNGFNDITRVFGEISRGKWIRIRDKQMYTHLLLSLLNFTVNVVNLEYSRCKVQQLL